MINFVSSADIEKKKWAFFQIWQQPPKIHVRLTFRSSIIIVVTYFNLYISNRILTEKNCLNRLKNIQLKYHIYIIWEEKHTFLKLFLLCSLKKAIVLANLVFDDTSFNQFF